MAKGSFFIEPAERLFTSGLGHTEDCWMWSIRSGRNKRAISQDDVTSFTEQVAVDLVSYFSWERERLALMECVCHVCEFCGSK